jgi:hypothetical protein
MQSWLRGLGRLSGAAARRLGVIGRVCEHQPAVAAGFADGRVTAEQVAAIAPVAMEEHRAAAVAQGIDLGEVDGLLADTAATQHRRALARVTIRRSMRAAGRHAAPIRPGSVRHPLDGDDTVRER